MDMSLDQRAASFNCSKCDYKLAALRNCTGSGKPAKNVVNSKVYPRCPKALWLEAGEARALVELYMDCRESKTLPSSGNLLQQTAFTKELFDFLDGVVGQWRADRAKKQEDEMKMRAGNGKK
jgi:hypothetical protein